MAANPFILGGGVLVAVAAAGGGAAYVLIPGKMPEWVALGEDSDFDSTYKAPNTSKYGRKYNRFLVSGDERNDAGGDGSFRNRYKPIKDSVKGKFSKVADKNALKEICISAYKEETSSTDIVRMIGFGDSEKYREVHVGTFCSPGGKKIYTVNEVKAGSEWGAGNIFGEANKAKINFVSIEGDPKENKDNSGFGEYQSEVNAKAEEEDKAIIENNDIKTGCSEAYKLKAADEEKYPGPKIAKYCSLSGEVTPQPATKKRA